MNYEQETAVNELYDKMIQFAEAFDADIDFKVSLGYEAFLEAMGFRQANPGIDSTLVKINETACVPSL